MKKKIFVIAALLLSANIASATVVDVSVATDKPTYQLGEYVTVSITAYNPNPQPVTLNFSDSPVATYIMDDNFSWNQGLIFVGSVNKTINANNSYTWNRVHGFDQMTAYPLTVGTHIVVGEVVGYGYSVPIQFEVIPEPATLLLLTFGTILVRHKRHGVNIVL